MSKVFIFETKHLLQAPTPEAGHRNQTCCFRRSKRFTYFSGMKPAAQSSAFKTFSLQVQQSYTEAKREWCASNRHLIELTHARRIGISSNSLMRVGSASHRTHSCAAANILAPATACHICFAQDGIVAFRTASCWQTPGTPCPRRAITPSDSKYTKLARILEGLLDRARRKNQIPKESALDGHSKCVYNEVEKTTCPNWQRGTEQGS